MGEVINMHKETAIHPTVHNAILELDATIGECINDAIQAGVPILMIMGLLQAQQAIITSVALSPADDDD